jgi:hypothetical protein
MNGGYSILQQVKLTFFICGDNIRGLLFFQSLEWLNISYF